MAGFYERRKSRAAIWCLRLAVVTVPFFILTIFLHRSGSITTPQAFWLIAFGIALLLASLVFGMRAAADLWEKGYKGGRATVNGIVLAIILLIPFGIQLFNALEHPQLNDVATDVINPPEFISAVDGAARPGSDFVIYDDYVTRQIVGNYPELVARRFDAPPERVAASVVDILKRWGWRIVAERNLPQPEPESDAAPVEEEGEELAGTEEEIENLQPDADSQESSSGLPDIIVQVQARSMIMKLPSSLVIRLSSSGETTLVDMRSASNWGRHDFGSNADNITAFLSELDKALAGVAGES